MAAPSERPRFERVDWSAVDATRRTVTPERTILAVGLLIVAALWLYDRYVAHVYLVAEWAVTPVDWAVMAGLVVLTAYGVVPAVRNREATLRVASAIRDRPVLVAALCFLGGLFVVGTVLPLVLGRPELNFGYVYQPPLGFAADAGWSPSCAGEIRQGTGIQRYCEGSLQAPLGTNGRGQLVESLLVSGARVAIYVVVFTLAFVVPLATAVGVTAGFRGGRLDDVLRTYVDVQLCIPAIFLYFVGYMYVGASLALLLATFGLLSWGPVARLVRSEVLQRREDGYVVVARSLGASDWYVARRHVLPNVTNTLVPAVVHLVAILIVAEAGVAFLGFSDVELYSWGSTIAEGLSPDRGTAHQVWWVSTAPAVALAATVVSLKLVGDGLRDVLDPRGEH
ncbi:ABC transporter permease [Halomicrobium sp. IBSBa]|uniref:ABC transporter permease n=1 Tax=Halomicrobium sp. IBSBa TaxID=2778916 RepID=UPI001ABFD93A|nr:ABC transporter permease [Halomicrobium sp. IBSBa]MBO4247125.1 ABC transporter permease [Halomicrobium sp. IBSBa]